MGGVSGIAVARQLLYRERAHAASRCPGHGKLEHLISTGGQAGVKLPGNRDSTAVGPPPASSGELSITAFVRELCPLARTDDHAKTVLTHHDTPDTGSRSANSPDVSRAG